MDLVALISGVSDALVGAVAALTGVYLSSRLTRRATELQIASSEGERRAALLRDRGEELYGALSHFGINFSISQLPLYSVMRGETSYNEYLDAHNSIEYSSKYDPHRMQMLVQVYFPELSKEYEELQSCRQKVIGIVSDHKAAYLRNPSDGRRFIKPVDESQEQFDAALESLKRSLALAIKMLRV